MHLFSGGKKEKASVKALNNFSKTHKARVGMTKNIHTQKSQIYKRETLSQEKLSLLQQFYVCDVTSFESQRKKKLSQIFALNAGEREKDENKIKNAKKSSFSVRCCYPDKHTNISDF